MIATIGVAVGFACLVALLGVIGAYVEVAADNYRRKGRVTCKTAPRR